MTIITITPEAARLRLAQYLSPAFPVGGFAWSQGLEWAMDQGIVTRATLAQWLADWLDHGCGWTDAVLVALSLRPGAEYPALDDLARAACMSAQRLMETVEQGAAFAANLTAMTGRAHPAAALPVAFGRACAGFPLPAPEMIAAFLQAQAGSLVSAAIRFMPLGPVEGQRMISGLQPALLATAARTISASEAELTSATWGADIAAMSHETMSTRIFRS
ncbi:urease accessory protein UreF [Paracoccus onubensis]|uniref:Urease accessory protein UreF n=1 Tax=Paracoccus onubensis TaxID=1675788 RepID=A0A418T7H4_9RHOB|nr:urease accessory UreF family protein [Paracoccus onubensis]RJE89152.1 urease accessory protein UreF [Paracoccus onubensis]